MRRSAKLRIKTTELAASRIIILVMILAGIAFHQVYAQSEEQSAEQIPAEQMQGEAGFPADIPRAPTPVPFDEQQLIYSSQGMRDPFVSLLVSPPDPGKSGLAAMKISEIKIQGIQIGLGKIAIVLGTDGKAYNMEVGQSLFDGKVVDIDSGKVVFEKVILDPFGREKDKQRIERHLHR